MKIFTRIVLGFLFILLLFSAVLIANFYQNQKIDENFKAISRSEEILQTSAELQKSVVNIQSDFRGFFISGSDIYLNPYVAHKYKADSAFGLIKNQLGNNNAQGMRIDNIQDSFVSWLNASNKTIMIYKDHFQKYGKDSALNDVVGRMLSKTPKRINYLKSMFSEFDAAEYHLRADRYQDLVNTRKFSNIFLISLISSAFIIGILSLIIVSLSIRNRILTLTEATSQIAQGDYDFRIKDRSHDELSAVSESINIMTKSLQQTFSKLKQSNKDLEQFAWIASHDLKEPMRMISIYTQILEKKYKGQLDEEADIAIKFIVGGIKKMYDLVNGLLEYARIGGDGIVFENMSTAAALDIALFNLKKLVEEKKASIQFGHLLPEVNGNKLLLVQLFQNLVHNAIKFNESGEPEILIAAAKNAGSEWLFSIKDNGLGIDPKYNDHVFAMFKRFQDYEKYEGTGIGLAYCKKIVELHGGRIWVESEKGIGSTFFFTLQTV